LNFNYNIP